MRGVSGVPAELIRLPPSARDSRQRQQRKQAARRARPGLLLFEFAPYAPTPQEMASLAGAAKFALAVAVGCAYILAPILDFLDGVSPRSAVLDAAVAVVLVTLPFTYLLGVILVFLHVAPAAPPMPPGASRRLAGLACTVASTLLAVLAVPLVAFLLLAGAVGGGCSPTGCGQR